MFFHNFYYTFKILLKNKNLVFWSILWPLILGTLFYFAFSNIANSEKLDSIPIGVVNTHEYEENIILQQVLKELSNPASDQYLFDIEYGSEQELKQQLEENQIDGYLVVAKDSKLYIKENGINQTIIKMVIDEMKEKQILTQGLISYQMQKNPNITESEIASIYQKVMTTSKKNTTVDTSHKNMDYMMVEFYTLMAMACLYSSLLSSETIKNYLANINKRGARVTLAPIPRWKLLLGGLLASFIIQAVSIIVLLLYTKFALQVDYGARTGLVILLSTVGSLGGLSLGMVVGSLSLKSENTRIGIMNAVVMVGCFLSGMMGVVMKYMIDKNIPLLNQLNPANMITDGFYSLYYYEDLDRFYRNMISLVILLLVLCIISMLLMRRKKYDSI